MEEDNMINIEFSYTDEYGQESITKKTFTQSVFETTTTLDLLVDEFKLFLLSMGHSRENVDKIQIIE